MTDEDIGYVQKQEQITANDGLQEQETVQVDKAAITGKVTIEDIDETDGNRFQLYYLIYRIRKR